MKDIVIGIDAGTSVIKSVAFSLDGQQLAISSIQNAYETLTNGGVEQDLETTWANTLSTLLKLNDQIPNLSERLVAISVTGQGDGTWLIDKQGDAVCPGWLWLDARAGKLVSQLSTRETERERFEITGTGLNACQQGAQLLWMKHNNKNLLSQSHTAFHCKDWLYFKLTGERVTDPSEGCFSFGNFRTRHYSDDVLAALGLSDQKHLLPPMLDGVSDSHPLSHEAAALSKFMQGTPVILGYVDIITTALGAGLYDPIANAGCTIVGSTGVHMKLARKLEDVVLNNDGTGYTMPMPISGVSAMIQTNMSSTLNIDWIMDMAVDLIGNYATGISRHELIQRIDEWVDSSEPSGLLYQPYISDSGERGPFINSRARAGFIGLSSKHRFGDMARSVIEGLAFAARDCYLAMGSIPDEVRLTGGAARSTAIRNIFGSVLGTVLKTTERKEAGAAGAAMMATVNVGYFESMDECISTWVHPLLGSPEAFDVTLHEHYKLSFEGYLEARVNLGPVWQKLANTGAGL